MDPQLNQLMRITKRGDFDTAVIFMKKMKLSTSQAVQVFVCICNACVNENSRDNITMNGLSNMISNTLVYITENTEINVKNYVASTYHIMLYLITQDSLEYILDLKKAWCPPFLTASILNESTSVYQGQYTVFVEFLITILKESNAEKISDKAEKLTDLIIDMSDRLPVDMFFDKGPYQHLRYLLSNTKNEIILSELGQYLLGKCLKQQGFEQHLISLLTYMISPKFPQKLLNKLFRNYDGKIDHTSTLYVMILSTLKAVITEGFTVKSMHIINDFIKATENDKDRLMYSQLLHKLFSDFYSKRASIRDKLTWKFFDCLYEIMSFTSKNLGAKLRKYQCCDDCQLIYDVPSQLSSLTIVIGLFKDCLLASDKIESDVFARMVSLYNEMIKIILSLKHKRCKLWENFCSEMLTILYNTAIYINRKKIYPKYVVNLLEIFVKHYLFAQSHMSQNKLIAESSIHMALTLIADNYLILEETRNAMATIAFCIFQCNKEIKSCQCIVRWIQVKTSNKRDVNIKKITMTSVLDEPIIKNYKAMFSKDELSYLLLKEIKIYNTIWPSKIPLSECCKEICQMDRPLLAVEALSLAWFDMSELMLPEVHDVISRVLDQVNNVSTYNSNNEIIHTAKVYFLQYHAEIKNLEDEIKKRISLEPQESQDFENYRYGLEVPDSKWDCTVHEQLKIDNLNLIKLPLLKSREIVEQILYLTEEEKINFLQELKGFEFIAELAFTFLLHGDRIEYLKTLLYCKKLAEVINSSDWIVKCIGWIMQESNCKAALSLFNETKNHLEKISRDTMLGLHISIATVYLKDGYVEKAIKNYRKAKNMLKLEGKVDEILTLELEFLEWNLMCLPCKDTFDVHYRDFIVKPSYLCSKLSSLCGNEYVSSRVKLMISHYETQMQIRYNYWLRCPREGRCVAKFVVQLCQRYILPLCFAETFVYLSDIDLMCEKLDDCQAKITGLSLILDIPGDSVEKKDLVCDNAVDEIANKLEEVALDTQVPKFYYKMNNTSPELIRETLKYPQFLLHGSSCKCFYCLSFDYQRLALMHIILKGNLWALRKDFTSADYFYKFAMKIYTAIISNKDSYGNKVRSLLNIEVVWDLEDIFAECYAYLLFNQGKISIGTKSYNQISDQLIKAARKIRRVNTFLYNEVYLQMMNHFCLINHQKPRLALLSPIMSNKSLTPAKTPEDNITQVAVSTSTKSPRRVPNHVVKSIKFNLSGDEDEDNTKGSDDGKKRTARESDRKNMGASSSSASSSSAPTKNSGKQFTVYTSKHNRTTAKENTESSKSSKVLQRKVPTKNTSKNMDSAKPVPVVVISKPEKNKPSAEGSNVRRSARNKANM